MIVSVRAPMVPSAPIVPSARESEPASRYVVPGVSAAPESAVTWWIFPFDQRSRPIGQASSSASTSAVMVRMRRRRWRGAATGASPAEIAWDDLGRPGSPARGVGTGRDAGAYGAGGRHEPVAGASPTTCCLLYTSDAADDL